MDTNKTNTNHDAETILEIEKLLVKTKTVFYPVIELVNTISHEENCREFNKRASRIYQELQELQTYMTSR